MRRAAILAFLAGAILTSVPSHSSASWVREHCFRDHAPDSYVKRSEARAYASVARREGYEWGGGCWNNNDRDDTPYAPDSGGEGPDCSGFVFKSWEMRMEEYRSGFTWWNKRENVHGPYASYDYHSPEKADPFRRISKSRDSMLSMDAFARNGHVGMLFTTANPSANTDWVIEARGDSWGTGVFEEAFRFDSRYTGARREGWTPECWPNCRYLRSDQTVVAP